MPSPAPTRSRIQQLDRKRTASLPRRGSIYLVATSGLVLVAGIGLAAMGILRVDRSTHMSIHETTELRRLALGGLELATQRIEDDQGWRSAAGGWNWSLAGASITVVPTDPADNNLTNDPFDDVVLTSWASRGDARQGIRIRFEMLESGGPTLALSLAATGTIRLEVDAELHAPSHIYTLTDYHAAGGSTTEGDIYAAGTITRAGGAQFNGTATLNAAVIPFPDPDRVSAAWITQATSIDPAALIDGHRLVNATLSSTMNPFGEPNPYGIYHIDNIKEVLIMDGVTITGTLIVTQAHSGIEIITNFSAAPADPAMPVLILEGNTTLRNADTRFNINGLALIVGDLEILSRLSAAGPIIVLGDVVIDAIVEINPTGAVQASPPAGFSTNAVPVVLEQGWIRAID